MLKHELLTRFFELVNRRDIEQFTNLLSEDVRFDFPKTQPLLGRENVVRFFSILFRQYPELSFEVRRTVVDGSSAAVHWTNRGINRKKEPYSNEGVTLLEFQGHKIRFISDFFKDTSRF